MRLGLENWIPNFLKFLTRGPQGEGKFWETSNIKRGPGVFKIWVEKGMAHGVLKPKGKGGFLGKVKKNPQGGWWVWPFF